MEHNQHQHK